MTRTNQPRRRCRNVGAFAALLLVACVVVPAGLTSASAGAAAPIAPVTDPASLVNPMIGTTGGVQSSPAADVPFGMLQWGPDTPRRPPGGGYDYADNTITGLSLTHLSGVGCPAYGDVPVLPTVGAIGNAPAAASAPFSHANEVATPGSYGVTLGSPAVRADLAVTTRSGIGRFVYPSTTQANLLVKTGGSAAGNTAAATIVVGANAVVGSATSGHFCGATATYTIYFAIVFSRPFAGYGTWTNGAVTPGGRGVTGAQSGAYVTFDTTSTSTVMTKVGVSFVSVDNALQNVNAENPGWDLATVQQAARTGWNSMLSRITISGGAVADQRVFYTALYHSLLYPSVFSDVNGQYIGFDSAVHTVASGRVQYANFAGWDTYRSQMPLVSMIAPTIASDIVQSLVVDASQNGGRLPKWSLANSETYVMVGDPAASLVAGAYAFGARSFDVGSAYAYLVAQAIQPNKVRPGLSSYVGRGYVATDDFNGCCTAYAPVSTTLEYATADFSIARLATALGDTANANAFARRAANWQHLFDADDGYLQQKLANGQFVPGPNPTTQYGYAEGNPLQYAWAVPHDLAGVIAAMGGPAVAVSRLNALFAQLNAGPSAPTAWSGNEPGFATPYAYAYAGAAWGTQAVVRQIENQFFTDQPGGEPGNDDLGAMSSWYVWSALGMYPVTPGRADLVLASPRFPKAVVRLGSGALLTVNAPAAAPYAPFVQSLKVNGVASNRPWLPAANVLAGTTLDFTLSTSPNPAWGADPALAPPSSRLGEVPALAYTQPSGVLASTPGAAPNVSLGVRFLGTPGGVVRWSAAAPAGLSVSPTTGTMALTPGVGAGVAPATIKVQTTTPGTYSIPIDVTVNNVALPRATLRVVVAPAGDLGAFLDDAGISDDANPTAASFDFSGFSYSRAALTAAGLAPGATVTTGGLSYRMPSAASTVDNIVAAGQTIAIAPRPGATKFGVLGSSANASAGAHGTATITYTDGTRTTFDLGLSDWTLGAGAVGVSFANTAVASTLYINSFNGRVPLPSYLFTATTPLDPTRTVASLSLPPRVNAGDLHVFALSTGS